MAPIEGDPYAIAKVLNAADSVHRDSDEVGRNAVVALKSMLNHPGTGRFYGAHQASAPGEPPAPETYALMQSVKYRTKRSPDGSQVDLYSTSEVAVYTEFGTNTTEDHQGMLPRPWMRPTMRAIRMVIGIPWARGIEQRERLAARRLKGRG